MLANLFIFLHPCFHFEMHEKYLERRQQVRKMKICCLFFLQKFSWKEINFLTSELCKFTSYSMCILCLLVIILLQNQIISSRNVHHDHPLSASTKIYLTQLLYLPEFFLLLTFFRKMKLMHPLLIMIL